MCPCGFVLFGLLFFTTTNYASTTATTSTNKTLNIVTVLEPPYIMKDPDSGRFSGLLIDVLQAAGISLDHISTPMMNNYGWEENPMKFHGVVGDLEKGKYDLAVAPFSILADLSKKVTFSQPVIHNGYMVLYKLPKDTEWKFNTDTIVTLIKPFSPGLWALLILVSLAVSVALHVIRRYSPYENEAMTPTQKGDNTLSSMSYGSGLMYLLGSLTGRNASISPRSTSGRILTAVWWLFSMMTVGAYIAGLIVILFKFKPHLDTLPFATVDEMIAGNEVKVLIVKESATYNFMAKHGGHYEKEIFNYWKRNWDSVAVDTFDAALKKMNEGNGKYGIFMDEALATYMASKEPCDKIIVGDPVGDDTVGFACPKGSHVCEDLNHVILHLQETGQMEQLREKWFWSGCHIARETFIADKPYFDTFKGKEPLLLSPNSITIHRFSIGFIILLAGFVLAALILVAEIIYYRRNGNIHHRLKSVARHDDAMRIQDQEFSPGRDT